VDWWAEIRAVGNAQALSTASGSLRAWPELSTHPQPPGGLVYPKAVRDNFPGHILKQIRAEIEDERSQEDR
jgi:hypothetical protein